MDWQLDKPLTHPHIHRASTKYALQTSMHKKSELHWLPFTHRIKYEVALLMFMVHSNHCPLYRRESSPSAVIQLVSILVPPPVMTKLFQGPAPSLVIELLLPFQRFGSVCSSLSGVQTL